jgi:hypothetical protein
MHNALLIIAAVWQRQEHSAAFAAINPTAALVTSRPYQRVHFMKARYVAPMIAPLIAPRLIPQSIRADIVFRFEAAWSITVKIRALHVLRGF